LFFTGLETKFHDYYDVVEQGACPASENTVGRTNDRMETQ